MSLRDTIGQIIALQKSIDDQMRLIDEFKKSNEQNISLVRAELGGTNSYETMLLKALTEAQDSLNGSMQALNQASAALNHFSRF